MSAPFILGWEEWVSLPDLGLPAIKAKVDTGARTSALHARLIEPFGPPSSPMVRFIVHPVPGREDIAVTCSAALAGRREVTSSNGDREWRFVIMSRLQIGGRDWPVEVTLTDRSNMAYRMLIGRQAIREDVFVDPTSSFRQPRLSYAPYRRLRRGTAVARALRLAVLTPKPGAPSARRIRRAAARRGHVAEILDIGSLSLSFEDGVPALCSGGVPSPHYDAVIPRIAGRGQPLGPAIVRQFEMMGSFALNSGDALEIVRDPVGVRQRLLREGLPVRFPAGASAGNGEGQETGSPGVSVLTVGGRSVAVAAAVPGNGCPAPAGGSLDRERRLAEAAVRVLGLGLAAVNITCGGVMAVSGVDAAPALRRFETEPEPEEDSLAATIVGFLESRVQWAAGGEAPLRRVTSPGRT